MAAISVQGLTKRFGDVLAVDQLNFEIDQGTVAGFLGPNGAGKTTTLRMLLGLVAPTSGTATVAGRPYRELPDPARRVGAVLEASGFHPGRSARDHLRVLAVAAGIDPGRADLTAGADRAVRVRTPQPEALRDLLVASGARVALDGPGQLTVTGATTEQVGQAAAAGGVVLHEMRFERSNLEDVFLELTGGKGERP